MTELQRATRARAVEAGSIRALARATGVDTRTIAGILSGRPTSREVCRKLGISSDLGTIPYMRPDKALDADRARVTLKADIAARAAEERARNAPAPPRRPRPVDGWRAMIAEAKRRERERRPLTADELIAEQVAGGIAGSGIDRRKRRGPVPVWLAEKGEVAGG